MSREQLVSHVDNDDMDGDDDDDDDDIGAIDEMMVIFCMMIWSRFYWLYDHDSSGIKLLYDDVYDDDDYIVVVINLIVF